MTVQDINSAISAHDSWRQKLTSAIRTRVLTDGIGKPLSVEEISREESCRFGKWLKGDSPTGPRSMPDYKDVAALNAAFHKEAGRVLAMALAGKVEQAEKETAITARFGKLSAAIQVKLTFWTTLFDKSEEDVTVFAIESKESSGFHSRKD